MNTDETPKLKEKLDFLITNIKPQSIAKQKTGKTIHSKLNLAKAMGLKSHTNLYPNSGRLSGNVEAKIREIYCIPLDSECWCKFAEGTDTDFINAYHELHPIVPQVTDSSVQTPVITDALEVDRTRQVRRETHPLASLVLFTLQPGPGEPWPISFELCCNPDEDEFDNVAVKRGRLIIDAGTAELAQQSRPGFSKPAIYEASQGPVSFTWHGLSKDGYVWRVAAEGDYIGNVGVPLEEENTFCKIQNLEAGNEITARFEIVLKDLTHRPDDAGNRNDEQLPIVSLGVEGLGEAKEWIVRRIKELAISDDDGRVLLAEHVVPFKSRGRPGQGNESQ